MQLVTYLTFDGTCEAAFNFYAATLRGEIVHLMRFADTPTCDDMQMPPELHNNIMHARLHVGDQALMGSDTIPQYPHEGSKGFSVSVQVDTVAEAERIFAALAEGGNVTMPIDTTFWAVRFGMLVDKFGIAWMVNCEKEA